jgi:hypothetical protein
MRYEADCASGAVLRHNEADISRQARIVAEYAT